MLRRPHSSKRSFACFTSTFVGNMRYASPRKAASSIPKVVFPMPVGASIAKELPEKNRFAHIFCTGFGGLPTLLSKNAKNSFAVFSVSQKGAKFFKEGIAQRSSPSSIQFLQKIPLARREEQMSPPQLGHEFL